jgi:hypothetical protein
MVTCNINEYVKFKLTKHGETVLESYLQNQKKQIGVDSHELYKPDCCGYIRTPLHDFMNVFGSAMVIGFDTVIENNELTFCGD